MAQSMRSLEGELLVLMLGLIRSDLDMKPEQ